jgi:hypothetical protein
LIAALALAPRAARAVPPEVGLERGGEQREVHVVHLASGRRDAYDALKLTKALEQRVLASRGVKLINSNKSLFELLNEVKCAPSILKVVKEPSFTEHQGDDIDGPCLTKMATPLGKPYKAADRFFWGWVYQDAVGKPMVRLNYWERGQPGRKVTLPLTEPLDRLADRLVQHLVYAGRVGDVRVAAVSPLKGELYVGADLYGRFEGAPVELTLPVGAHNFELRQGEKVLAQGRGVVLARESRQIELEPVVDATPRPVPPPPPVDAVTPPPPRSRAPSPFVWASAGLGLAGLTGAGVFFALRQGAESDLHNQCSTGKRCPEAAGDALDRSRLYGTLAPISLGVGLVGLGAGAYFLVRPPAQASAAPAALRITGGGAAPVTGGVAAHLVGSF